jgi:hypothetical protein
MKNKKLFFKADKVELVLSVALLGAMQIRKLKGTL